MEVRFSFTNEKEEMVLIGLYTNNLARAPSTVPSSLT
jgi:hypothetical protein